jgi:hypothetical protein
MASRACEMLRSTRPAWSVGYKVLQSRAPTADERSRGIKRVILRWEVYEVSPVGNPAGAAVGTLEVSCG